MLLCVKYGNDGAIRMHACMHVGEAFSFCVERSNNILLDSFVCRRKGGIQAPSHATGTKRHQLHCTVVMVFESDGI